MSATVSILRELARDLTDRSTEAIRQLKAQTVSGTPEALIESGKLMGRSNAFMEAAIALLERAEKEVG